jgi:hypothetical protein
MGLKAEMAGPFIWDGLEAMVGLAQMHSTPFIYLSV